MKTGILRAVTLLLAAVLLAGCSVQVNLNKKEPSAEELLSDLSLTAESVAYDPEGAYTVTIRRDEGGFRKMDLSQAYVAYYPFTIQDQIDAITDGNTEDVPPLPADAQNAIDEVTGAKELQKIAVITVETVDDNTLRVSFTDRDDPLQGKEYYFIIPNEGLSAVIRPE